MTRDLPVGMNQDAVTPNTGGSWMWLCEIVVPTYSAIRRARNTKDVTYAGDIFLKCNMDVGKQTLFGDGSIPRVVLRISQDAGKTIENIINDTEGALDTTVKLIKVNSNFLDVAIPALEADYDMLIASSDSDWVTFTIGIPNLLTQQTPTRTFPSSVCDEAKPAFFKGPRCQYVGAETSCTGTYEDCRDNKNNAINWGGELGLSPNVTSA